MSRVTAIRPWSRISALEAALCGYVDTNPDASARVAAKESWLPPAPDTDVAFLATFDGANVTYFRRVRDRLTLRLICTGAWEMFNRGENPAIPHVLDLYVAMHAHDDATDPTAPQPPPAPPWWLVARSIWALLASGDAAWTFIRAHASAQRVVDALVAHADHFAETRRVRYDDALPLSEGCRAWLASTLVPMDTPQYTTAGLVRYLCTGAIGYFDLSNSFSTTLQVFGAAIERDDCATIDRIRTRYFEDANTWHDLHVMTARRLYVHKPFADATLCHVVRTWPVEVLASCAPLLGHLARTPVALAAITSPCLRTCVRTATRDVAATAACIVDGTFTSPTLYVDTSVPASDPAWVAFVLDVLAAVPASACASTAFAEFDIYMLRTFLRARAAPFTHLRECAAFASAPHTYTFLVARCPGQRRWPDACYTAARTRALFARLHRAWFAIVRMDDPFAYMLVHARYFVSKILRNSSVLRILPRVRIPPRTLEMYAATAVTPVRFVDLVILQACSCIDVNAANDGVLDDDNGMLDAQMRERTRDPASPTTQALVAAVYENPRLYKWLDYITVSLFAAGQSPTLYYGATRQGDFTKVREYLRALQVYLGHS